MVTLNQKLIGIDDSKLDMAEAYLGHYQTSFMDIFNEGSLANGNSFKAIPGKMKSSNTPSNLYR